MATPKVAIVGAGIAGLTAALRLAERRFDVTVFEERIYLGGKLGAHRHRLSTVRQADGTTSVQPAAKAASGAKTQKTAQQLADAERRVVVLSPEEFSSFSQSVQDAFAGKLAAATATPILLDSVKKSISDEIAKAKTLLWRQPESRNEQEKKNLLDDLRVVPSYEKSGARRSPTANDQGTTLTPDGAAEEWLVKYGYESSKGKKCEGGMVVSRYEKDGKKLLAAWDNVYHEHCYHMFLNWYHNFWRLMSDVGVERSEHFAAKGECAHLFPGPTPIADRLKSLTQLGAFDTAADNLLSGAQSAPDMFLWFFSMIDLASQPINPKRYLNKISVNGFLNSRWYATDASAAFNEEILTKAFAIPTYLTSASAYQNYVSYTAKTPDPMLWVMKKNSQEGIFAPLAAKIEDLGGTIHRGERVVGIKVNGDRTMTILSAPADIYGDPKIKDDGEPIDRAKPDGTLSLKDDYGNFDYVILAVPPAALAELIESEPKHRDEQIEPLRNRLESLTSMRKLQSGVTAVLDLYFTKQLDDVPDAHVILRDAKYGLSFVANSHVWEDDPNMISPRVENNKAAVHRITCLNVAASDFAMLAGMDKSTATKAIIKELHKYLQFDDEDIDFTKTYLQMNQNEPLFLNQVGSEVYRPPTRTEISNLFLAGDFCDNFTNIVTVEGAVVSGLQAARAVQAQLLADESERDPQEEMFEPIAIEEPETYPRVNFSALKLMLAPYAVGAKLWARAEQLAQSPSGLLSPDDLRTISSEVFRLPGTYAADWWNFALDAAEWAGSLMEPGEQE